MGQKVNPNSFRLNVTRGWSSEWYGKQKYPIYLQEDLFIRNYIFRKLNKSHFLGSCLIQRSINNTLNIHLITYTKKKKKYLKSQRIKMLNLLSKFTNMNIHFKIIRFYPRYNFKKKRKFLKWKWRRFQHINEFFKIMRFKPNADLISNFLKKEIEKQKTKKKQNINFFQFLKQEIFKPSNFNKSKLSPVLGLKIQFKGRLNGKRRARKQFIQVGSIPLSSLHIPIQYSNVTAFTKYGSYGIKVWVAFKQMKYNLYDETT